MFPTWVGGGDPGLTCPPIRRWVGLFVGGDKGQPRASVSLIRKGWVPFRRGKGVDPHSPPPPAHLLPPHLLPQLRVSFSASPPRASVSLHGRDDPNPRTDPSWGPKPAASSFPSLSGVTLNGPRLSGALSGVPHPTHRAVPQFPPGAAWQPSTRPTLPYGAFHPIIPTETPPVLGMVF